MPDRPNGFSLMENEKYTIKRFEVQGDEALTVAPGDCVDQDGDGYVARAAANAGVTVVGVVTNCYNSSMVAQKSLAASTAGFVDVALALPGTRFIVQGNGTDALANIGATANHVDGAADTFRGRSIQELNSSDYGSGLQLRVLGRVDAVDNAWGSNTDMVVVFNESIFAGDQASV